ncbi:MAG TPA: glycosyltransferase, partial [Chloroflexota bacterium]
DTDRLPDDAARLCNAMDRVWLPSDFHREVFESAGVDASKIRLLPPCAPASTIAEASPISLGTGRSFNFLTLVEWTPRSGWDIVVRAFASAFQPDDDVALVILAYSFAATNLQQLQGEIQQVLGSIMGQAWRVPPITVNLGLPSAAQRPGLYRAAQACVHANRGARGSRALLEAMTCGCPAIGTGWGGNLAFMTDENSYLIESGLQAVPGADGQQWAESSVEHLAELMQGTVKNRAEADAKGARARAAIARDFSPAAVGRRLRELYSDVRPG